MSIRDFVKRHFKHFNAAVVHEAAEAYKIHLEQGGKMLVAIGGAMSTAELGISLAEMIRKGKVHAISCSAANLEEDIFNLVAHKHYERLPGYRNLSSEDEMRLYARGMNRVTDTCIPEEEAMRRIEHHLLRYWKQAEQAGERHFPYEYFYTAIRNGDFKPSYQIDPKDSWVLAACEKSLPIFTPGWEDSTMGNVYVGNVFKKELAGYGAVKSGLEQMDMLVKWYREYSEKSSIGFFQIGGGIAGDFAICVVPLLTQDLKLDVKRWGYFCQISDSTTSYGSYSGAVPNEKITWGKLDSATPRFVIESDATIVAPLIFAYVLGQ